MVFFMKMPVVPLDGCVRFRALFALIPSFLKVNSAIILLIENNRTVLETSRQNKYVWAVM